ncbi:CYTH domain-containing protein [Flavobacterium sp.]|jgi:adenylate cyclase|uniref:CYTH domain-containing protein n=1 Tax=Flavobacterium sp. TaxID=239 RepID=UPI0037BEBAE9
MIEIERKFLVTSFEFKNEAYAKKSIIQGYLSSNPERMVRIRTNGKDGFITIKGKGNKSGMSRFEWEKMIPLEEATALLKLCEEGAIEKIRYEVKVGDHVYEVDEFFGENEGLVMAEIELESEDEVFKKPSWLGKEVTNDEKYYNAYLSNNPFTKW